MSMIFISSASYKTNFSVSVRFVFASAKVKIISELTKCF